METKIVNVLTKMGFETEKMGDFGYKFEYEGLKYVYMLTENDNDFLSISAPGILDVDDVEFNVYLGLTQAINENMKYVKAYTMGDSLWLFYEREMTNPEEVTDEELEEIISRMIIRLEAAVYYARKWREENGGSDEDESAEEDDDSTGSSTEDGDEDVTEIMED